MPTMYDRCVHCQDRGCAFCEWGRAQRMAERALRGEAQAFLVAHFVVNGPHGPVLRPFDEPDDIIDLVMAVIAHVRKLGAASAEADVAGQGALEMEGGGGAHARFGFIEFDPVPEVSEISGVVGQCVCGGEFCHG